MGLKVLTLYRVKFTVEDRLDHRGDDCRVEMNV